MKVYKFILAGVAVLGLGMTACNNDDVPSVGFPTEGNTFVGRCLKRQPSFFVMQPVYYPFLYLKYLWSSQLLLFEKSSYRNK